MGELGTELHDVRLYHCVDALVNSRPAYAIARTALAECLNMRVEDGELAFVEGVQPIALDVQNADDLALGHDGYGELG